MSDFRVAVKVPSHLEGAEPGGIQRGIGGLSGLMGMRTQMRGRKEIQSPYRESGWVHACLKPIGQAVAQVPLEFWTANPDKDKKAELLPEDHPLHQLFRAPNPMMTQAQFFEACALHRKLDGVDVWWMLDERGEPIVNPASGGVVDPLRAIEIPLPSVIVPLRGKSVSYRTNEKGWPIEYQLSLWSGATQKVAPQALTIFRDFDPDDPLGGLSDVNAALSEIDLDWQSQRYQRALLENSGDPGGWIKVTGALGQPEERALKNELAQEFKVDRAGEWRILTGKNVEYVPNEMSAKDMQYHELVKWCRDKIAAILGVPLPVIGVLEHATLANVEQLVRFFWTGGNGILAYQSSQADVINGHFLPRLKKDRDTPKTVYARFNTSGVRELQPDKKSQLEAASIIAEKLHCSPDEALKLVGFNAEPLEHGKVVLVSTAVQPIDRALEEPEPEEDPDADPKDDDDPPPAATEDDDDPDDDADKALPLATKDETPTPTPAEESEAFKERTAYWQKREAAYARAHRATLKQKYIRWRRRYEAAQVKRIRDFAKRGPEALRALQRDILDELLLDPDHLAPDVADVLLIDQVQWSASMRVAFEATLRDVFGDAIEDLAEELGVVPMPDTAPSLVQALETQLIQLAEGHTSVLAERVRAALIEGLQGATSIGNLQALVVETLPVLEENLSETFADRENRARMIARTEVGHASSSARNAQMVEAGVEEHEWISSRDQAVRGTPGGPYEDAQYSHYELDGKSARLGTEFDHERHPGLTRPHDPNAEVGDVANCRCYARPLRKET